MSIRRRKHANLEESTSYSDAIKQQIKDKGIKYKRGKGGGTSNDRGLQSVREVAYFKRNRLQGVQDVTTDNFNNP